MGRMKRLFVTSVFVIFLAPSSGYAGMSDLQGWHSGGATTYAYWPEGQDYGTAQDIDINGEVGHPLDVTNPTCTCTPGGNWNLNAEVISGTLPPGLKLGEHWAISGIPTKRGHWIVKIRVTELECGGENFKGFEQELRFHITGTGEVFQ